MGEVTGISWTDRTSSPWHGCTKVSPGCDHCYAAAGALRNPKTLGVWGQDGQRVPSKSNADKLRRWNDEAAKARVSLRVFPSICDPFEDFPGLDELRSLWFRLLEETPNLIHLLLTKRPENVRRMVPFWWVEPNQLARNSTAIGFPCSDAPLWPRNVWLGTTVEDQQRANERLPHMVLIPAAVRFLSVEPQLESVDLRRWMVADMRGDGGGVARLNQIHWVIQGGESGHGARPFMQTWARSLRDECAAAGVPYFFKQAGANNSMDLKHRSGANPSEWSEDLRVQQFPDAG